MLAAERRNIILQLLNEEGRVQAADLSVRLGTCEDTIRRDLRALDAEGSLQRVHGGALMRSPAEARFSDRQRMVSAEKLEIAQKAAQLIEPAMVVFLSGGTTNAQLASLLPKNFMATIITNNPAVAVALTDHTQIDLILVGGRVLKRTMVSVGVETVDMLRTMRADMCMLGVCSVHAEVGLSIPDQEEVAVQQAMIANAAEVVALVSQSKLNTASHFHVADIEEVNTIVTEASAPNEVLQPYRDLEIEIIK
ncbi:MAG: DeoR/GlpR transcriptional regulator [Anaerolineaceae bacterium]|nr:DeoR/GlpR transcriptional regulator [Anaerolineaceae bacterium]